MYCIYQINDNNEEKIIDIITKDDFVDRITNLTKEQNPEIIKNGIVTQIKNDKSYKSGLYLLIGDKDIVLVNKYEYTSKGYFFSSTSSDIKLLFSWRLISMDLQLTQSLCSTESEKYSKLLTESDEQTPKVTRAWSESDDSNTSNESDQVTKVDDLGDVSDKSMGFGEFQLDKMCDNPSIALIAKRGSGKTWVIGNILKQLLKTDKETDVLIIAPTEKFNKFYSTYFPQSRIVHAYSSELVSNFLTERVNNLKSKGIIVLDDCLQSKCNWMNDPAILELFYNGRHYNTSMILSMQFPLGIRPELRCNFDYAFLLAEDFMSNQKRLYDHYGGMFPTFGSFRESFTSITQDYKCMVIENRGSGLQITDKVKSFKAISLSLA